MELTEVFWTIFVATASALVFGLVKACLKSKCDEVACGVYKFWHK